LEKLSSIDRADLVNNTIIGFRRNLEAYLGGTPGATKKKRRGFYSAMRKVKKRALMDPDGGTWYSTKTYGGEKSLSGVANGGLRKREFLKKIRLA